VSPFGTWAAALAADAGLQPPPRASPRTLRFGVAVPATERPGSRWWALVKVMYFGRVRYSQAVPVSIEPG
jgi:alpha-mannosidase